MLTADLKVSLRSKMSVAVVVTQLVERSLLTQEV